LGAKTLFKVILWIIGIILAIGIVKTFFFLILAAFLGYQAIKNFGKYKELGTKPKRIYVYGALCVVSLITFFTTFGSNDSAKELTAESTSSPTTTVIEATPQLSPSTETTQATVEETTENNTTTSNLIPVELVKVTDGDTIVVKVDDKEEKVRFLLIDTPESVDPNEPVQPFAKDASAFTKKQLSNGDLSLELDVSERDKYGRLLAYVWVGDKMLNELLLEKGYARVAYIFAPNTKYVDQFQVIQKTAQKKAVGIWSVENYVQDDGYHEEVVETEAPSTPKPTPEPEIVQEEEETEYVYYANCTAVREAGAAPIYEGDPGYSTKLDRDRDGVACEQ
jgi:micrococcal nuclease